MSSKRSQDETFHDFMVEINNLLYVEAYEVGEISDSQYDKLKRELDDYM